jgi:DNA-binding NarL/FixJ family response regulator
VEEMTKRVRLVLVDDEALVRAGLRLILEGDPAFVIVGEASDGQEALAIVRGSDPDVVLMDIRMPHLDGLAATELLIAQKPGLKVIVLTTFDTDEFVLRALRIGASGFLLKDTPPGELIEAVRRVAAGRTILSQSVTEQLIAAIPKRPEVQLRENAVARLALLTDREREVAVAIAEGLSNAEIASTFYISLTTVKTHVGRILDKLAVDNRVQIAICVHTAGTERGGRVRVAAEA